MKLSMHPFRRGRSLKSNSVRTRLCASIALVALSLFGSTQMHSAVAAPSGFSVRDGGKLAPNVLLLLDNSGSMERVSGNALPSGACSGAAGLIGTKNRWQSVVDAVGGPLVSGCAAQLTRTGGSTPFGNLYGSSVYDVGYDPPHFLYGNVVSGSQICVNLPDNPSVPGGTVSPYLFDAVSGTRGAACTYVQTGYNDSTGFFSALTGKARVGMMMFDSEPDPDKLSQTGLWSYTPGAGAKVDFPGCTNNNMEVGARNSNAPIWEGKHVVFPAVEAAVTDSTTNLKMLRDVLRSSRPYGATPIAGMLQDASDYLSTTANCHDQYAILLSDGAPNLDGRPACSGPSGVCPYQQPRDIAASMRAAGITVYTIGFSVNVSSTTPDLPNATAGTYSHTCGDWYADAGTAAAMSSRCSDVFAGTGYWAGKSSPDPHFDMANACCTLHSVAVAGGTERARYADAGGLSSVLDEIQKEILRAAEARTVPVSTPKTSAGQSTYATAYVSGGATGVNEGDIQRISGYTCTTGSSVPVPIDPAAETSIGTRLGKQAYNDDRDFFTVRVPYPRGGDISLQPTKYIYYNTDSSPQLTVNVSAGSRLNPAAKAEYDPTVAPSSCPNTDGSVSYGSGARFCTKAVPVHVYTSTADWNSGSFTKEFIDWHDMDLRSLRTLPSGIVSGTEYTQPGYFLPPGSTQQEYIPGMRPYNGADQAHLSFLMVKKDVWSGGITGRAPSRPGCVWKNYAGENLSGMSASDPRRVDGDAACAASGLGACNYWDGGEGIWRCAVEYPVATPGTCNVQGKPEDMGEHQCPFNAGQFRCPANSTTCTALGPIQNSVPAIVGPPSEFLPDLGYQAYAAERAADPTVMYVQEGGLLHAFDTKPNVARVELWAFLPPAMQTEVVGLYHSMAYPLLDTTPIVRDMPLYVTENDVKYGADVSRLKSRWRRVVLSGLGDVAGLPHSGGWNMPPRGYYALDVTGSHTLNDSEKKRVPADSQDVAKVGGPKFLWQITDVGYEKLAGTQDNLAKPPTDKTASAYPLLLPNSIFSAYPKDTTAPSAGGHGGERGSLFGLRSATPALTTVAIKEVAGTNYANQIAVAILPGGLDASAARDAGGTLRTCTRTSANTAKDLTPAGYKLRTSKLCWGPSCNTSSWSSGCDEVVKGRYVVITRVDTGEILRVFGRRKDFTNGSWGPTGSEKDTVIDTPFEAPMVGTPVVYPMNTGAVATKFFMSDAEGVIWRFDISSNNSANWRADVFFDTRYTGTTGTAEDWREVGVPIEMSLNEAGESVLLIATGEQRQLIDGTAVNYVYSITEKKDGALGRAYVNHVHKLPVGYRVVGPMVVNDGYLYYSIFKAQTPSASCPSDANSLICARHYLTPKGLVSSLQGGLQATAAPVSGMPALDDCWDMGAPTLSGIAIRPPASCTVADPPFDPTVLPPGPSDITASPASTLIWSKGVTLTNGKPSVGAGEGTAAAAASVRRSVLDSWVAVLD